jgi:RNA polymerase sigma factor (sigma-70 family)
MRNNDAESLWLQTVGKYPVLPHEQLMEKFKDLESAYSRHPLPAPPGHERPTAEALRSDPVLRTRWDEYESACEPVWAARRADPRVRKITDAIVKSNLRLVVSLARKRARGGMGLMPLVSAGNEGLLTSIERFDWRRGFRFSTYATWWIRQAIGRWITDNRRTIRTPAHANKVQRDMIEEAEKIERAGGAVPDRDELARRVGASAAVARATLHTGRGTVPLDARARGAGGEEGRSLAEVVPDPSADPFRDVSELELIRVVEEVMTSLNDRDLAVLRLRFGLAADATDDAAYPITPDELSGVMEGRGLGDDGPTDADLACEEEDAEEEGEG